MKAKIVSLAILAAVLLTGCATNYDKSNPPTQRELLCSELKRNLIFNKTAGPSVTGMSAASATQRAQSERLYEKNNCGNLEKK